MSKTVGLILHSASKLLLPFIFATIFLSLWFVYARAGSPANMADSTVSVAEEIEDAAAQALGDYPPITATHYAITHLSEPTTDYYMLSVVGLSTTTPTDWNMLDDVIWWGNVIVYSDAITTSAGVLGTITYTNMLSDAYPSSPQAQVAMDAGIQSSEPVYFPWQAGTQAYYGTAGVHEGVIGLENDRAVDWFGGGNYRDMPNMVYASQSGYITRVCEDGVSIGLVIGDFGYLHLQPWLSFTEGDYVAQGQQLGPMVLGSFDDSCGYAIQQPSSYHVHWAFIVTNGYFQAENWTLSISTEDWTKGSDTVSVGQYMTAFWAGQQQITPTPGPSVTPGGPTLTPTPSGIIGPPPEVGGPSFWDPIVYGVWYLVGAALDNVPSHAELELASTYLSAATTVFRVTFILMASNFDLRIPFYVLAIMLVMEGWRIVAAVFRKILEFIGYILKFIPFLG